jgi:hypothetical protein
MHRMKASLPCQTKLSAEEEALRLDVFWEAFVNTSLENFERGVKEAQSNLEWFPTPVKLRELIVISQMPQVNDREVELMIEDKNRISPERAKAILKELYEKWETEDKTIEAKRIEDFEDQRKLLLKQAELIKGKA